MTGSDVIFIFYFYSVKLFEHIISESHYYFDIFEACSDEKWEIWDGRLAEAVVFRMLWLALAVSAVEATGDSGRLTWIFWSLFFSLLFMQIFLTKDLQEIYNFNRSESLSLVSFAMILLAGVTLKLGTELIYFWLKRLKSFSWGVLGDCWAETRAIGASTTDWALQMCWACSIWASFSLFWRS